MIDITLFFIFLVIQYLKFLGIEHDAKEVPAVRLSLIILAFLKLLFFVRIFEQYGFLVQMIILCLQDLIPFIVSYIMFLFIFTICFMVLQMETDS